MLKVKDVEKSFGGLMAVAKVSFNVNEGDITAIIGPNGAGKTTLINIITGVYKCDKGKIFFKDKDITNLSPHKIVKHGIIRTFQNLQVFKNMTVLENVMVGMHSRTKYEFIACILNFPFVKKQDKEIYEKSYEILKYVGLENKAKFPASSLPYGEQKKLELARALSAEPKLLILDEPVAGLNLNEAEKICELLIDINKNRKITIILIEHNMNVVMELSKKIIVLHYGEKIAEGTPFEIQNNPEVIRAYLGNVCTA